MKPLAGALLLLVPTVACAQSSLAEPDILSMATDQVARLTMSTAGLTLLMPLGVTVDTVVLGDTGAFVATVDPTLSAMTVRPLRENARSTLSVASSARPYYFELTGGEDGGAVLRIEIDDAAPAYAQSGGMAPNPALLPSLGDEAALDVAATYKLSGDRALRPVRVTDDGRRTTIEWGDDQALPAVFGVGPTGAEEVVDGHMRDGATILERVWPQLVFRMDDERARAKRRPVR